MEYRFLGDTDIKVSALCLGTMTWGEQNSQGEAFEQLDMALDYGVNFIDTAEMYPVPPRQETYGATERILGNWFQSGAPRDQVVLASKAVGPSQFAGYIRDGAPKLNRANLERALDDSLKRLQTDYIDLYQLHWPDRSANFFGQREYVPREDEDATPIEETLEALSDLVDKGKIRHIGLSNETPWGTMRFAQLAEQRGWPRVVSIQNPYNLLNRTFEIGLAEVAHREAVGLLAYSPLAFGTLSGKYLDDRQPENARLTLWSRFGRYTNPQAVGATREYVQLARDAGLDPAQMALAFVTRQPFVTSNILGATSLEQLKANLDSAQLTLSDDTLSAIDDIHQRQPNPAP